MHHRSISNRRGWKDHYQDELWVIPADPDDGGAGVSPHILHRFGSRSLKKQHVIK